MVADENANILRIKESLKSPYEQPKEVRKIPLTQNFFHESEYLGASIQIIKNSGVQQNMST